MGLGSVHDLSLVEVRRRAAAARHQLTDGLDPIDERLKVKAQRKQESGLTFSEIAMRYVREMAPGWRSARSSTVWTSSLERLVFPTMGKKRVAEIESGEK